MSRYTLAALDRDPIGVVTRFAMLPALLLLAGCVTVVVPTATPEPTVTAPPTPAPSPVIVTGYGGAGITASSPFDLAAGSYNARWIAMQTYCRIALDLVRYPEMRTIAPLVLPQTTAGQMNTPAPVVYTVAVDNGGTFAVQATTATCDWGVSLTQVP